VQGGNTGFWPGGHFLVLPSHPVLDLCTPPCCGLYFPVLHYPSGLSWNITPLWGSIVPQDWALLPLRSCVATCDPPFPSTVLSYLPLSHPAWTERLPGQDPSVSSSSQHPGTGMQWQVTGQRWNRQAPWAKGRQHRDTAYPPAVDCSLP
jgi:hypothetical protein